MQPRKQHDATPTPPAAVLQHAEPACTHPHDLFQPKCYNLIFSSNYICQHQDVSSPKWQREICASWENNCVLFSRICQSET